MWEGGLVGGLKPADQYLMPDAFSSLMREWQKPNQGWLYRARYATYKNMVHVQHAPHEAKIVSAKSRFEFVTPWRDWEEKDRPRPGGETTGGSAAAPTESDAVALMVTICCRGESLESRGYKWLREGHRVHIEDSFRGIYPPIEGRSGRPDDDAGAGEEERGAAVAARARGSPFLERALKNRCDWTEWARAAPPSQRVGALEQAPPEAVASRWELHSMRGYMDNESILMCSSSSSWRVALPDNMLSSDPVFTANYPSKPSKLYLHKGFCGAASRAGVDLAATTHTASSLLVPLRAALLALEPQLRDQLACPATSPSSPTRSLPQR